LTPGIATETVVLLKTATAYGITIAPVVTVRAMQIIEGECRQIGARSARCADHAR